ncbi:MAG: DUF3299 domain-containing protein [Bacteroidota bacterium]
MSTSNILPRLVLLALVIMLAPSQAIAQKVISWDELADLKIVENKATWEMEFGPGVKKLAGKDIQINGFMMPLENTMKQKHFILSMVPLEGCQFCAPGTQSQFIEVKVSKGEGIEYTMQPIEVAGTLELLPDGPMGVFFLIKDARQAD